MPASSPTSSTTSSTTSRTSTGNSFNVPARKETSATTTTSTADATSFNLPGLPQTKVQLELSNLNLSFLTKTLTATITTTRTAAAAAAAAAAPKRNRNFYKEKIQQRPNQKKPRKFDALYDRSACSTFPLKTCSERGFIIPKIAGMLIFVSKNDILVHLGRGIYPSRPHFFCSFFLFFVLLSSVFG